MEQFTIECLTPIHIGTGHMLGGNTEYIYFDEERMVSVLDHEKVLSIIGEDQITKWTDCITNRENMHDYLIKRKPDLISKDISLHEIPIGSSTAPSPQKTKEGLGVFPEIRQQFTSAGKPVIPGSSLKGSLRTAYLTGRIEKDPDNYVGFINNLGRDGKKSFAFTDKFLQKNFLGADANRDLFRIVLIGDTAFDRTECIRAVALNQYGKSDFQMLDGNKGRRNVAQFVECIAKGAKGKGRLGLNATLKQRIQSHTKAQEARQAKQRSYSDNRRKRKTPDPMKIPDQFELKVLLKQWHNQTLDLLEDDLERVFQAQLPHEARSYSGDLEGILDLSESFSDNEYLIRVGYGSGFLSMTGAWQENNMSTDAYDELCYSLRARTDLPFPRSRRLAEGGSPLGIAKMTIE